MRVDRARASAALVAVLVMALGGCEVNDTDPIDEDLPATAPER